MMDDYPDPEESDWPSEAVRWIGLLAFLLAIAWALAYCAPVLP